MWPPGPLLPCPMPAAAGKYASEVTRGALLAVHSASGLVAVQSRISARLVRAAEGLLRAALAELEGSKCPPPASQEKKEEKVGNGTSRSARRRRRRQAASATAVATEQVAKVIEKGVDESDEAVDSGPSQVQVLEFGTSVYVGDLSELGVGTLSSSSPSSSAAAASGNGAKALVSVVAAPVSSPSTSAAAATGMSSTPMDQNTIEDGIGRRHHRCHGCQRRLNGEPIKVYKEQGTVRFFTCQPCWKKGK